MTMKAVLVIISWLGSVAPMTQEIPVHDMDECNRMKGRIAKNFQYRAEVLKFEENGIKWGAILDCRPAGFRDER